MLVVFLSFLLLSLPLWPLLPYLWGLRSSYRHACVGVVGELAHAFASISPCAVKSRMRAPAGSNAADLSPRDANQRRADARFLHKSCYLFENCVTTLDALFHCLTDATRQLVKATTSAGGSAGPPSSSSKSSSSLPSSSSSSSSSSSLSLSSSSAAGSSSSGASSASSSGAKAASARQQERRDKRQERQERSQKLERLLLQILQVN
jgi:hypothetical protein